MLSSIVFPDCVLCDAAALLSVEGQEGEHSLTGQTASWDVRPVLLSPNPTQFVPKRSSVMSNSVRPSTTSNSSK